MDEMNRLVKTLLKECLVIMLSSSFSVATVHAATFELKEKATAGGSQILLGDVLNVAADVDSSLLQKSVNNSPLPGAEKIISRDMVEKVFLADLKGKPIEWSGAKQCVVTRPARLVQVNEVSEAIVNELRLKTGEAGEVKVMEFAGLEPFNVPNGDLQVQVEIPDSALSSKWTVATIRYSSASNTELTKSVRFRWAWIRDVWQAKQSVKAREVVSETFFEKVPRDILGLSPDTYMSQELPKDTVLKSSVASGNVLRQASMNEKLLVKRGTMVDVEYRKGGVFVAIKGQALSDGARGELIPVQNINSQKKLYARVMTETTLQYEKN
jgi:flagella basal body P-ring formation protein FlgA